MQALFHLVHSLAKEEKRLFNLHGKKSRYVKIYEAYLQADRYDKSLDRDIYQKHFGAFSKPFYSMQKGDLMEDILGVLLEYSNSNRPEYLLSRLRSKYGILLHRGQHDAALPFLKDALKAAEKGGDLQELARVLEDLRDTLPLTGEADFEAYEAIVRRLGEVNAQMESMGALLAEKQRLQVLIRSVQRSPETQVSLAPLAADSLGRLRHLCHQNPTSGLRHLLESEAEYGRAFDTPLELHRRFVALEKGLPEATPPPVRLQAINLILETAMDNGDFLLFSGLIYKCSKILPSLSSAEKRDFLPSYLEKASLFHFYENEAARSLQEMNEALGLDNLTQAARLRILLNKAAVQLGGNQPKAAMETLQELYGQDPAQRENIPSRMLELALWVEMNQKEEAMSLGTRIAALIRKHPEGKAMVHERLFLDMVRKILSKTPLKSSDLPHVHQDWHSAFRPFIWLRAKLGLAFYYNAVMDQWQTTKKVMNVA